MSEEFKEVRNLLTSLCDQFEQIWLEREALKSILVSAAVPDWNPRLVELQSDRVLQAQAQAACQKMRTALLDHTVWAYLESSESAPPTSSVQ
jgi:hypothetical protein